MIALDLEREARYKHYLRYSDLVSGGAVEPHWLADGTSFWYAEGNPDQRLVYQIDPTGTRTPFFDVDRLQAALSAHLGHRPPYDGVPFETFTLVDDERRAAFVVEGRHLTLDLGTYAIEEDVSPATEEERDRERPRFIRRALIAGGPDVYELRSPDGRRLIGERDGNLTLRSTVDGREGLLTEDATSDCFWSAGAVRWASDSLHCVATRFDCTGMRKIPLVHWLKKNEEVEWAHYAKTGEPLAQQHLVVIDILSGRQTPVDTGEERDTMLAPVFWTPDGRELHILKMGRGMKPVTLLRADAATGETREVLTEHLATFAPHLSLGVPEWMYTPLSDGRFLWLAARDGWSHLYLYDGDGTLVRQLTHGDFPVLSVVAVDEAGGWVYFRANGEARPYDTNLYRVRLDGDGFARLTDGEGQHEVVMAPSLQSFVDTFSSPATPPRAELRAADGRLLQELSAADISRLESVGWHPPEEFTVLADDGVTELHGLLYFPADFDAGNSYPVVEWIYGGPQSIIVPHSFAEGESGGSIYRLMRGVMQQALAQLGFIVMSVDGRGTPGRSQSFHDHAYGNFGQSVIPDHVAALRQLMAARPYMDPKRVGVYGLSWGGFNTLRAMTLAPEVYSVGIATNPVADMDDHMASAGEQIMGLPTENQAGYAAASNLAVAGNLQGKLLLVHATSDTNATFSATMKMVEALTRAGKPYDLIVLPEQNHHPSGTHQAYWLDAVARYFVEHLRP
jgi:dipeptidyl aminopeptidase/acylaminoacyl peptidase